MKNKIILFLLLSQITFSQTNFSEYFPLKIGNIFVYNARNSFSSSWSNCQDLYRCRITVTDTLRYLGKLYYLYSRVLYHYSGNGQCGFSPYMFPFNVGSFIRLDTLSGKIYYYSPSQGCSYSPDEIMIDSLKSNLNDMVHINCVSSPYFYE